MSGNKTEFGKKAFNTTASISFPRLVGSAGEGVARERIGAAFEKAGLEVGEEWFECSDFAISVAARWAVVPTGTLLLMAAVLGRLGFYGLAIVAAAVSLLPAVYVASRARTGFSGQKNFKYRCANVVGRLPAESEEEHEKRPLLILMAHYDSKSQVFPIWLRVALFVVAGLGSILTAILIIACSIVAMMTGGCVFGTLAFFSAVIVFLVSISFLLNTVGNLSDGALDNATGVGIITEIAAGLCEDPPKARILVVATAAEEIGLCGANAFLEAHEKEMDRDNTFIINFDGCGGGRSVGVLESYGLPKKHAPKKAMELLRPITKKQGIPLKEYYIPIGMATDLMPLRHAGYEGIDFLGIASKSHTTEDRMDLVKEPNLVDYVKAGSDLARALVGF